MKEKPCFSLHNLEQLSRIRLSDEEKKQFPNEIERILQAVATLDEVDTSDIPPCRFISSFPINVQREDLEKPTDNSFIDTFFSNAPSLVGRMIKTPPVMKS
ncbi:MAG: Asp-tRNA(Asn)/Glu-tRNA(Gln) amidotransferase subunit GatC [Chlamydiota bacterium]